VVVAAVAAHLGRDGTQGQIRDGEISIAEIVADRHGHVDRQVGRRRRRGAAARRSDGAPKPQCCRRAHAYELASSLGSGAVSSRSVSAMASAFLARLTMLSSDLMRWYAFKI